VRPAHFIVQDRIARDNDPRALAGAVNGKITYVQDDPRKGALADLEREITARGEKPILFCSLQIAAWVRFNHPGLASGICLPEAFLRHSNYSSLIAPELLLNPEGLYLPWGQIPRNIEHLERRFGSRVFLRPDSSLKPFPGFDVAISELQGEWSARCQTDRVAPGEMCFIAPAREVPELEYRVWIVDAQVITSAPYSWHPRRATLALKRNPDPDRLACEEAAARLAQILEMHEQCYTADFTLIDGTPRLVELNAITTSGWYSGLDVLSVFRACDDIFI